MTGTVTTTPRAATEQACDWADKLALDILADIAGRRHSEAMKVVAFRLRALKREGLNEGSVQAREAQGYAP